MSTIQGKVESKSRNGGGIKVQGQWYNSTPATLAVIEWKDTITMEVDGKNIISITKDEAAPAAPAKPQKKGGGGWDDPNRQAAIIFQSSRKDAIEITNALLSEGILPLPSAKNQKYDAYMAFLDNKTRELFIQAMEVQETGALPVALEE